MEHFDLDAPADLFVGAGGRQRRRHMTYRRFETGAEAVKHVVEGLSADAQYAAVVETDDVRLGAAEIREIYDGPDFPLPRCRE